MVSLKSVLAAIALLSTITEASPIVYKRGLSFAYGSDKVRGVNLGGWFVLEPWITPSIFQEWANGGGVVDEYTYSAKLGKDEAHKRLSQHWNSWITQDDFNQIAKAGLNHVRIPVGYWAVAPIGGDPYVQGQLDVLDQAIGWARSAGLKVLIDLHGAPGSQNGFDNSGRLGAISWQPGNDQTTLDAIKGLSQRYLSATDVVTAIELLNEPMGFSLDMSAVKKFYYDGWGTVRNSNSDTAVVIHDAFQDMDTYWNGFMSSGSGTNNVMLDTHQYQIFSPGEVARSQSDHIKAACSLGAKVSGTDKWTVVGEWTGAMTDCAKWLNGLGKGARYDGTFPGSTRVGSCDGKYSGTVAGLSSTDKSNLRAFVEAQLDAYEKGAGWIFWTWKNEGAPEWHMQDLLAAGLFPQPLNNRQHPGQCN